MFLRLAPLRCLIVDTDEDLALRTADLDRGALGAEDGLPVVGAGDEHPGLGIDHHVPDLKYALMIVIGHIQAGDLQTVFPDRPEEGVPAYGGEAFKRAAALAGHLHPGPHIRTAIVMHADASKIFSILIAPCALRDDPGNVAEAQDFNELIW